MRIRTVWVTGAEGGHVERWISAAQQASCIYRTHFNVRKVSPATSWPS